ncbi:TetR/AcrR family transcriptional regulator [Vibrio sp. CAU 1672]|uniref:TetR/AcrR family transcriptional regulator n=1 Tax=Vibrio sp. CAU 1672 TaxID=3032594 RepID=UPI0023D9A1C9|nr:TetR/AcrR family transcriptional regulator [Vibrio sp. CAU 1672]MDF2153378.1 TetR/AcrR family transcriptional regulator [Vibrio sp. CAU 1672]
MARKPNFDREEKLLLAMELFWRKGFARTSISDLTEELNINRFSLYNTYGDKQQLYYEALDTYLKKVSLPSLIPLEQEGASLGEVEAFLNAFANKQIQNTHGCFIQNALVEHAGDDTDVLRKGHFLFNHLLETIGDALANAQQQGLVTTRLSSMDLAKLILSQIQGMRMLGKAERYTDLNAALEALLTLIKSSYDN